MTITGPAQVGRRGPAARRFKPDGRGPGRPLDKDSGGTGPGGPAPHPGFPHRVAECWFSRHLPYVHLLNDKDTRGPDGPRRSRLIGQGPVGADPTDGPPPPR
ncbi:MAG: hypothetical protein MPJ22_00760 [Pirellulales bacterium]|nr:hypothetical protein [Pirellulales bacterium]